MMASPLPAQSSRASSPSSTISEVDLRAPQHGKTIDDLTVALANFSRAQTPDVSVGCCCRRKECESMRAWADVRAKLESRLVLSAEVGQALLQRYEAYVRRQDAAISREASSIFSEAPDDTKQQVEILSRKLDTVMEENSLMESRIQELLIKSEMSEATTRTLQRELHEARSTAHRLAAQQSRSAGWELRLAQHAQEIDDMRQERDAAVAKERHAEMKAFVAEDKCATLQSEVEAARGELNLLRSSRAQFSKDVLREAKYRIETLRHSLDPSMPQDDPETTRVLETLVADNETLKRSVLELNGLLSDSRDELEEARDELAELRRKGWDSLGDGLDDTKIGTPPRGEIVQSYRSGISSSLDIDLRSEIASSPFRSGRIRSRGVQTDPIPIHAHRSRSPHHLRPHPQHPFALPSPKASTVGVESVSSHDIHSDTSSLNQSDPRHTTRSTPSNDTPVPAGLSPILNVPHRHIMPSDPRPLATITSRVSTLLTRMSQADARTLSLRLRRQNLLGDPKQISEATVKAIVTEAAGIRLGKEDTAILPAGRNLTSSYPTSWTVSRAEFKSLLRLIRDLFTELGILRTQLNEVIFDPTMAQKLRKDALKPEAPSSNLVSGVVGPMKAEKDRVLSNSWMSPIRGLFGSAQIPQDSRGEAANPRQSLLAPKQAPAVAASTTTVNVEFASGMVRGTGTYRQDPASPPPPPAQPHIHAPIPSRSLLGIFAGATQPQASAPNRDQWVVLPREGGKEKEKDRVKQLRGTVSRAERASTIGRAATSHRRSRNLESSVYDPPDEQSDFRDTLLQRTLRPRGLSDSSIHTTFLKGEPKEDLRRLSQEEPLPARTSTPPKEIPNTSVTVVTAPIAISPASGRVSVDRFGPSSPTHRIIPSDRALSPIARLGRVLPPWAHPGEGGMIFGSPREEPNMNQAAWARRTAEGRDF